MTFNEAIDYITGIRTSLYRHSAYPYLLARQQSIEMFNYSLIQGPACMMLSWIPVPVGVGGDINIDFKSYNLGRYFTPLYTICSPDPKDMGINIDYMYRVRLSTQQDIESLHEDTVKVILAGLETPDITIGELLDMIDNKE